MRKFTLLFILLAAFCFSNSQAQTLSVQITPSQHGSYNISCNGADDGSLSIDISNGTAPYILFGRNDTTEVWTVLVDSLNSSINFNDMQPGTYFLMVTDSLSDTAYANITLSEPSALEITLYSPSYSGFNIHCNGGSDGEIVANVTGGITPYSYLWSTDSIANSINTLVAGEYSITVTDDEGCTATQSKTLTQPNALQSSLSSTLNAYGFHVNCAGGNTAAIDLTAEGGAAPYTFTWNSGDISEDLNNKGAGTYNVRIDDNNGCFTYDTIVITEPPILELSANAFTYANGYHVSCNSCADGQITLSVTGGSGSNQFAYRTNGAMVMLNSNTTLSSMYADTIYHFFTMDVAGCMDSVDVSFSRPPIPVPALELDLFPKTYIGNYNISQHGANDGRINAKVSGGIPPYTYLWNTGDTLWEIQNLTAGTYSITVTDAANTSVIDSITLNEPSGALEVFLQTTQPGCNNPTGAKIESYVIGGTPPYAYSWTDIANSNEIGSLQVLNNPLPGTYRLTVIDANNDTVSAEASINIFVAMGISVSSDTNAYGYNVTCFGGNDGSINLEIEGGIAPYDIWWSNGETTQNISGLAQGFYSVNVKDSTGCDKYAGITLTSPEKLGMHANPFVYGNGLFFSCDTCNDAQVTAIPYGGIPPYSILWNTGETSPTLSNIYADSLIFITVTDAAGCVFQDSGSLNHNQTPPQPLSVDYQKSEYPGGYNVSCYMCWDGWINLNVSGGFGPYNYYWTDPNNMSGNTMQNRSMLQGGNYSVRVTDTNGDSVIVNITMLAPGNQLTVSVSHMGNSCNGIISDWVYANTMGGTPPYQYFWKKDGDTLADHWASRHITEVGFYEVLVTDANGDSATTSFTEEAPGPQLTATILPLMYPGGTFLSCESCPDGRVYAQVSGGTPPYTYYWSYYHDSTYTYFYTDTISGLGYGYSRFVNLTVNDTRGCSASYTYSLNNITNQNPPLSANYTTSNYPGGYNVSCYNCNDGWVNLNATGGMPPYNFYWNDGYNGQYRSMMSAGNYNVRVTDTNGDSVGVNINLLAPSNQLSVLLGSNTWGCDNINGNIYVNVMGGTPPYTYQWSGPMGTMMENWNSINISQQGTYYVTVTDANNTSVQANVNVFLPASVNVQVEAVQQYGEAHTSCSSPDGRIIIHLSGGTPPYNVNVNGNKPKDRNYNNNPTEATEGYYRYISTSDTLIEVDSLWSGWYDVWVNDMNGCGNGSVIELQQAEPPRVQVDGTIYENGYYFSCDTCHDAQLSASVTGGNGNPEYYWFEVPSDFAGMKIIGASLFMNEDKGDASNEDLPPAISTSQTASIYYPETVYGLVVADELGCSATTNFTLDKPKPVTGWQLKGNVVDSTFILGSVNVEDMRIVTSDTTRIIVRASGNVEIIDSLLTGQVRAINLTSDSIKAGHYLPAVGDSLIHFGETSILMRPTGSNKWIGTNTNSDLSFKTSNTSRLVFKGNGDINLPDFTFIPDSNNAFKILGIDENGNLKSLYLGPLGPKDGPPSACSPILPWTKAPVGNGVSDVNIALCDQYQNVGIGYINPQFKLQVNGDAGFGSVRIGNINNSIPDLQYYNLYVRELSTDNPNSNNPSHTGIRMDMRTSNIAIDLYSIDDQKSNFRVFGNGEVYARDVKVRGDVFPPHPDYVFESDYELMPLLDLERYLITNKHLPEIPSAREVEEDGYSLGNMNIALLKKIEELTLYMINVNKENETLKERMAQLERELQNK
jgi:hypothetical protein